jgi:hypothetical protein
MLQRMSGQKVLGTKPDGCRGKKKKKKKRRRKVKEPNGNLTSCSAALTFVTGAPVINMLFSGLCPAIFDSAKKYADMARRDLGSVVDTSTHCMQLGGPELWRLIDLGQTEVFTPLWIYTDSVSAVQIVKVGTTRYELIPKKFYREPTPEWAAVDLLNCRQYVAVEDDALLVSLAHHVRCGHLNLDLLSEVAKEFGTPETVQDIEHILSTNSESLNN